MHRQYEEGLYSEARECTQNALKLCTSEASDVVLKMKLLIRQAKALLQLHDYAASKSSLEAALSVDTNAKGVNELLDCIEKLPSRSTDNAILARRRVCEQPRYRHQPLPHAEYWGSSLSSKLTRLY